MTSEAKLILGITGGLAAGLLIGYFTAPDKGSETRKKIMENSGKWKDSIAKMFKSSEDGEMYDHGIKEAKQSTSPL
ncbi:YtxH domain-containing protein [Lacibacter sp. H375]|uniref:YtxH domain-containing protein n=1 Tax=Lacibacter sp. H375 TaxID=3133424 RepID=UPI0030C233F9